MGFGFSSRPDVEQGGRFSYFAAQEVTEMTANFKT
jgi:hypothetical protein